MRGDALTVKERVDIVDLLGGYIKLEKAGSNYKARCPFHNEKTASFHISPSRQTYYCFGCGKKGDVFTFVEEMEGTDFRGALNILADRAGIELENAPRESRGEKDRLHEALEEATKFFEGNLKAFPDAHSYIESRGISEESIKHFRIGYAENDWRKLRSHLLSKGFNDEELIKAGLTKRTEESAKEPYDVFRGRIIFPLSDASGKVIAFSGRAIEPDAGPKYLNSPDTVLFQKSEVLYGLDKAKDEIRKKNYAILVEGQMDLVLSHQAGVPNAVASSGTAFTRAHLERLKRLSPRIILAFDADAAGEKAAEKSTVLGLSLGMEVKVAKLPLGKDPADLVRDDPETWKDVLRKSVMAIEFFLVRAIEREPDQRKLGKIVEKNILPLVALIASSIERSHFVSLIAKHTRIREEVLWDDLKNVKVSSAVSEAKEEEREEALPLPSVKQRIEERLKDIEAWQKELPETSPEVTVLAKEKKELEDRLAFMKCEEELGSLISKLARAESGKEESEVARLTGEIQAVHKEMKKLEETRKVLYN
ncbi:MAG: dnaG [Parcubacteria group bacterium]|nr:dnaG [Parcubacteria group bacterium]